MTSDLSDGGVGIISGKPIEPSDKSYSITIWPNSEEFDKPYHFIGKIIRCQKFSHVHSILGVSLESMIDELPGEFEKAMDDLCREVLHPTHAE